MLKQLKRAARAVLPEAARGPARSAYYRFGAAGAVATGRLLRPRHWWSTRQARRLRARFAQPIEDPMNTSFRIFDYDVARLPNAWLAELESRSTDRESARRNTGLSIGYPAWGLLYYAALCGLPRTGRELIVLETGTNHGASTIVLAQALKDSGGRGRVSTVDIDPQAVEIAAANVRKAGLEDYVEFHVMDSLTHVRSFAQEVDYIDFAFLDGCHGFRHVLREFALLHPRLVACNGTAFFDNTVSDRRITGGVSTALRYIKASYGGNVVEFKSSSGGPPGNAIWQQD